jgi:hypothetical protein
MVDVLSVRDYESELVIDIHKMIDMHIWMEAMKL